MTDLEAFAGAALLRWRSEGRTDAEGIPVSTLVDRVLPYRIARRRLGIDINEDYEALVLRLIAGAEGLAQASPSEAATAARETMQSKLPDLTLLHRLREASLVFTDHAAHCASEADGVTESSAHPTRADVAPVADPTVSAGAEPSPRVDSVLPRPDTIGVVEAASAPVALPQAPTEPIATLTFAAPAAIECWGCAELLPTDREVKFCPFCGADQRRPVCPSCGAGVERRWRHCPDCGTRLGER